MGDDVLGISLLGAFSITVGGHVIPDDAWRLRKAKTLIKLLALAPERRLHADRATELLWARREEASARNNLHQAIFAARRALDSAGLVLGGFESTHQAGWVLAVLAAMSAEDGEPAAARRWLDRAIRQFELLGGDVGMAYCRELERGPGVATGSTRAE